MFSGVYFVQEEYSNLVKIGHSLNIKRRIKNLQCACPGKLTLIHWFNGTRLDEQRMHKVFSHLRERGEWFNLNNHLLDFIKDDSDFYDLNHSSDLMIGDIVKILHCDYKDCLGKIVSLPVGDSDSYCVSVSSGHNGKLCVFRSFDLRRLEKCLMYTTPI